MISYNHFLQKLALLICISAAPALAQTPDANRSDPVREFQGSDYLDREIASRKMGRLRALVEKDLVRLGRMVETFGEDVSGANVQYEETAAVFKKAIDAHYSGELLESYHLLRDARRRAFEVYGSFNEAYQKKASEILSKTTSALVDQEIKEAGRAKSRKVQEARHRVRVAQRQLEMARRSIANDRPDAAVAHYRNATVLAVVALAEMQTEKARADEIYSTYKKELKDAGYDPYPLKPDQSAE